MSERTTQMTERGKRLLTSLLTPVEPPGARFLLTQDILAIEAEARLLTIDDPAIEIVKRAARMGLCSQTHHEHLMIEARAALAALTGPSETGDERG